MDLVSKRAQVVENVYSVYSYIEKGNNQQKEFAASLLRRGWVYVAEQVAGEIMFAPSKFVGYVGNTDISYPLNRDMGADGRETNVKLAEFYGKERTHAELLERFKKYLSRYGIQRNYETDKTIRFLFLDNEVFNEKHVTYFISPTHIPKQKDIAWESFWDKNIAAIGWDIGDHAKRSWNEIEMEIKSREYENQEEAIDSHKLFSEIVAGDLIAINNVNHGLFGIGVALTGYRYDEGIHYLDVAEEEDGYSHYVEVAWLYKEYIKSNDLPNPSGSKLWEPYGAISVKSQVPDYILQILLNKVDTEIKIPKNIIPMAKIALNTILYGPPGTGKTYHTIVKAAEIITGESYSDPLKYNEAKTLVNHHLNSQDQVEFVTFHQNYSYEDFVAGLRPDIDGASIGLRFTEHRGIFYRINERAKKNWDQHKSGQTYVEPTFEEVLEVFLLPLVEDQEIDVSTIARNVSFHITSNNNGKNLGFRKKSGGTGHTLSINTLKDLYEGKREYNLQGLGIYFRPLVDRLKDISKTMRRETGKIDLKHYVLIIDEINRANISRVFGELITLLEDDKRLGAENELKLRLPGLPEDEHFGVAPNLYLVGTMNTADKSIALIDIALRRRFVFEDMYPREEVVNRLLHDPYNAYLLALNERIKALKGADFMIGHAYMIGKTGNTGDVVEVFNQKIIPLLNEYFYNQRNTSVHGLLSGTPLAGIVFDIDPFIGAKARAL